MFGRKTKRIKELEAMLEAEHDDYDFMVRKHLAVKKENENLRLDNGRLRNEVSKLQSQVQKLSPVRDKNGKFTKK